MSYKTLVKLILGYTTVRHLRNCRPVFGSDCCMRSYISKAWKTGQQVIWPWRSSKMPLFDMSFIRNLLLVVCRNMRLVPFSIYYHLFSIQTACVLSIVVINLYVTDGLFSRYWHLSPMSGFSKWNGLTFKGRWRSLAMSPFDRQHDSPRWWKTIYYSILYVPYIVYFLTHGHWS